MGQSIIRLMTEVELEALAVETFINSTDLVTKVTDHSAIRGIIRGNIKTSKKALKDIALAVSHLFPDTAFDVALDAVAGYLGIAPRLGAAQSSTWVRVVGDPGTIYTAGVNAVSDNKGNVFDLESSVTLGALGYDYVPVRSQQSGAFTNVDPYTIINISPEPSGHIGVLNEYASTGGRDAEDDATLLQRIKEGPDILSRGTLSYLTQAFIKTNSNVLRVIYQGTRSGKVQLAILTVNGIDLTEDELNTLLQQGSQYFSLTELNAIGTLAYGVELLNATYYTIDCDFRISLTVGADLAAVVKEIQQKFSKAVDFRFWDSSINNPITWLTLLSIVKNTQGVASVSDNYFSPSSDIFVPRQSFPRFRGFIIRDLQGIVLINQAGTIQPIFYANQPDVPFAVSVL